MICKDNQKMIDTVLRLKSDDCDSDSNRSNKIASIMSKPNDKRTKEENQELTISIIQEMVRKENNRRTNNKIASAVVPKKGEVAELQSYLPKLLVVVK